MACPEISPDTAAHLCDVIYECNECNNLQTCENCPFLSPENLEAFIKKNNEETL
jgi:hypothetical protein